MIFFGLFSFAAINLSAQTGKTEIADPEVFELANVAFALTEFSVTNPNMTERRGDYYARVAEHFAAHKNHALVRLLDEKVKKNYSYYITNRAYAVNFAFDGGKLVETNLYPAKRKFQMFVSGDAFADRNLWEDFAAKSGFRKFYADNCKFYNQRIAEVEENLPLKKIRAWLEREFPERFDRYLIFVSPLIYGTHSTFRTEKDEKQECFMFVADASGYDGKKYTPRQIEGLYTGIVFTEIDHNYNNPISYKYEREIKDALPDAAKWSNGVEAKSGLYKSALKIFDEYATHSLFLIYVSENFSAEDYEVIKNHRTNLMVNRRGFPKFKEFHEEFLRLYKTKKPTEKISDLYLKIIEWAKKQS